MAGSIVGKVVEVTSEGDLITDITSLAVADAPRTDSTKIVVDDEHETFGIFSLDHKQPAMTLIAILDEATNLKLHLTGDSAAMMLGVRAGAPVKVSW